MIVNLTPHIVRVADMDGAIHEFEPSGTGPTAIRKEGQVWAVRGLIR